MRSGPSGSRSQAGACFHMPGMPTGKQALGDSEPALPKEQASPGGTGETKVTRWPSRCSHAPVQVPTMPVPNTTMCMS